MEAYNRIFDRRWTAVEIVVTRCEVTTVSRLNLFIFFLVEQERQDWKKECVARREKEHAWASKAFEWHNIIVALIQHDLYILSTWINKARLHF